MIETSRLLLRPWTTTDLAEFTRIANTPAVMEHLGGVATPEAMQALYDRIVASQAEHGFCFWIVERHADRAMLGICGFKLANVGPIMGEIEIGWRFRQDAWGQGYAREAATACLDWAWRNLACTRIVAITIIANRGSWGLMERLGMTRQGDLDFDHPNYPADHPQAPHITYAIARPL